MVAEKNRWTCPKYPYVFFLTGDLLSNKYKLYIYISLPEYLYECVMHARWPTSGEVASGASHRSLCSRSRISKTGENAITVSCLSAEAQPLVDLSLRYRYRHVGMRKKYICYISVRTRNLYPRYPNNFQDWSRQRRLGFRRDRLNPASSFVCTAAEADDIQDGEPN